MDRLVVVCRAGSAWVVKIRLSEWSLHPGPLAESGLRWRTARRDRGRRRTAVRSRLLIRRHDSADRSRHAPRATRVTPAITNGLVFTPVNGKLVAVGAGVTLTGTTVGGAAGGVFTTAGGTGAGGAVVAVVVVVVVGGVVVVVGGGAVVVVGGGVVVVVVQPHCSVVGVVQ